MTFPHKILLVITILSQELHIMFIKCDLSLVDGFTVLSVISCDTFSHGFVVLVDAIVVIIDDEVFVVVYVTLSSGHNKA